MGDEIIRTREMKNMSGPGRRKTSSSRPLDQYDFVLGVITSCVTTKCLKQKSRVVSAILEKTIVIEEGNIKETSCEKLLTLGK